MTHDNPKIRALLTLGKPKEPHQWPDYINQHGLSADDVTDLLALVCDASIDELATECPEVWGPLHAWRSLGQIGHEQAIEPLVAEFDRLREDDYGLAELPVVIGMIGPAAIPVLEAYWREPGKDEFTYVMAMDALCEIARRHPPSRERVIRIYRDYMQEPSTAMGSLNGLLMAALLDLDATEAIDDIRRLFSLGCVDPGCAGDLEDIEMELGLRDKRSTPKPSPAQLFGIGEPEDTRVFDDDDEPAVDIPDIIEQYLLEYGSDESILSASELDGFLAALACSPQIVLPSLWIPEIWGGPDAQPVWDSLGDANDFNSAIMMLHNHIMQDFNSGEFEPLFLHGVDSDDDRPIVGDWCEGFMRGLELWEELPHHQRVQLESDLTPIEFFASAGPLDDLQDQEDSRIEALQFSIQPQVMKIYRQFRREFSPASSAPYVRAARKVGRNEPCPCGSGKKYKKCCGAK